MTKRTHPFALMRTVDRLNLRFGRDTVTFAAAGIRRPWKMSRRFLLPWYTTAWDELLAFVDRVEHHHGRALDNLVL